MNKYKYQILLTFTLISLIFCLALPIYASLNYVRVIYDERAVYYDRLDDWISTFENTDDALIVFFITLPSLMVVYIPFLHYILIPLYKPELHHPKILPIFYFRHRIWSSIGKFLSYLCMYTMPIFIPLGIYFVYNTKEEEYVYNDIPAAFVYLLPMGLLLGAWMFFVFYIIYFFRIIIKQKKNTRKEQEEWFIY